VREHGSGAPENDFTGNGLFVDQWFAAVTADPVNDPEGG
jgi:hypothetical protein